MTKMLFDMSYWFIFIEIETNSLCIYKYAMIFEWFLVFTFDVSYPASIFRRHGWVVVHQGHWNV